MIRILIVLLLLSACNQKERSETALADSTAVLDSTDSLTAEDEKELLITCKGIGEISLSDNLKSLGEKVGANNITSDSLFLEGTFEGIVSILWEGTDREITIRWIEREPPYHTIRFLEIREGAVYKFSNGIRIGTSMEELAALNEAPFELYGFGWDYGGTFADFNEGKLAREIPCFGGVFSIEKKGSTAIEPGILGDKKINSDHPNLQGYTSQLSVIRISRRNP